MLGHWLGARVALLFAFALPLREPFALVGSPFHPTALAAAHLVVLGFLATQIVGLFHLAGPHVPRRPGDWRDWTLLVSILLAAGGVASHMALGTYSGVEWSGGLLLAALLLRVPSWWHELAVAPDPAPIRVGAAMAWLGLLLTVCLGVALAIDRGAPFLPAGHLHALGGHAHLGAAGFALLMLQSLAMRWLPMYLPAAPPPPALAWTAVLGTGAGALGFGTTAPFVPATGPWFAVVLACGVAAFLAAVGRMLWHREPAASGRRLDPCVLLVGFALLSLVAALAIGLSLAFARAEHPSVQLAYGVVALLGGLGSLLLGLGTGALPVATGRAAAAAAPGRSRVRGLQWVAAIGWIVGVGTLAAAVPVGAQLEVRLALWLLLLATVADTATVVRRQQERMP